MTKLRTGDPFMTAHEYSKSLPRFTINLLVRNVEASLKFYVEVLGVTVRYRDPDFAALSLQGWEFMLHADHTYDHHPLYARLSEPGKRGTGAELRFLGVDPDAVEARAKAVGATMIQPAKDYAHGWREVTVADPDGYIWVVGMPIPPR